MCYESIHSHVRFGTTASLAKHFKLTFLDHQCQVIVTHSSNRFPSRTLTRVSSYSLWISLFISTIDTTIVTTALFPISTDLPSSLSPTWVLVVYLLTYTSFLLVATSFSDIFGMKAVLLFCNISFLLASMACSIARNMIQLIIFRALQGVAGSGLYNLPFVVVLKVVEPDRVSKFTTIIGCVFAMANLLGPILGGAFANSGKWRLMFIMNIPLSTVAFVLLFMAGPDEPGSIINHRRLRRMDWLGAALSIGWAAPLVLALQEGGDLWTWDSAVMKWLLCSGGLGLLSFIVYEGFIVVKFEKDPVMPCSIFRTAPVFWLMMVSFHIHMSNELNSMLTTEL
jgi:MFS family permease